MLKNKYVFVCLMLLGILAVSVGLTNIYAGREEKKQEDELVVVTSFYPMYIAGMNVIGDVEGVTLKNLSEPQTGCLHDFQLTPSDMKLLSTADVFIINGGGMESFMEEIAGQYPDLKLINACANIHLLGEEEHSEEEEAHSEEAYDHTHNHGANAHAWMSIELYRKQVLEIGKALAQIDEAHAATYLAHVKDYDDKLCKLQEQQELVRQQLQEQSAIMLHCAYEYIAEDYDMQVAFCMDLDDERQVSAKEVAEVVDIIGQDKVQYIFAEELYAAGMCNTIKKEVDVKVIYLDPLTRGSYDADAYLKGMEANIKAISEGIQ